MTDTESIDVFFYGLFMDRDRLVADGYAPGPARRGSVAGLELRVGERAALVPGESRAHGIVMAFRPDDLDRLYSAPDLRPYGPITVSVDLEDGQVVAARCYNLASAPGPDEHNPDYAARLREVARRLGLPDAYVDSIH